MAAEAVDVPYATLHTGAKMPLIGLGTWNSAPGEVKAAVIDAVEAGYRHIDGAAMYKNEKEVGEGIADVVGRGVVKREELFVTSKLPPWATTSPELVSAQLTETLSDLGLEYLDLWLIHWPFFTKAGTGFPPADEDQLGYNPEQYLATWRAMEAEVAAGRVKHIGCSNVSNKKLAALLAEATVKPAVNQVECHPTLAQTKLVAFHKAHGVVVTAYSPLGSPGRPDRLRGDDDPHPMSSEVTTKIAEELGATPAQVLIAYQIKRGVVVIPKSVTKSRIVENFASVAVAHRMTDAHVEALTGLDLQFSTEVTGKGRLIKGGTWLSGDATWESLWDDDWEPEA